MVTFICSVCSGKTFRTTNINDLTKHLRREHALFNGSKLNLKCCCPPCELFFKTYSGFRKHLLKHCSTIKSINETVVNSEQLANDTNISSALDSNTHTKKNDSRLQDQSQVCDKSVSRLASLPSNSSTHAFDTAGSIEKDDTEQEFSLRTAFLLKLESTSIPKSSLDFLVAGVDELLLKVYEDISTISANSSKSELNDYLRQQKDQLKENATKYKRHAFFSNLKHFVKPVQISLGTRYDQKYDRSLRTFKTVALPCTMTYIPILQTIDFILSNEKMRRFVSNRAESESNLLRSFADGDCYACNDFYRAPLSLRLQLYYDDFESVNPLGSKTSGHKVGAFYMTIQNFPPELNTKLHNIFLVALFYASDIKRYGINSILKPVIKDIKILEKEGIQIDESIFKGTLGGLSFDNLGGNILYGMVESFSATHFCRICTAPKEACQKMTIENKKLLRSSSNFQFDPAAEIPQLGVKTPTVINELRYFNTFDCQSVDIMHDILEGVGQLEIKLFLNFLVQEKLIAIETLNNRINSFDYGRLEMKNKPSPVLLNKPGGLIGQRASQAWCLLRFLPLIIADIVRKDSPKYDVIESKWKVIVLLIQIASIVFSPVLSRGLIDQLTYLIDEHHSMFQTEFKRNLTPKHHFITHYPTIIRQIGPLVHFWAMRFEGKHNYFKHLVHEYKNYKNITKTLASQHQRYMYYEHKIAKNSNEERIETVAGKFVLYEDIIEHFNNLDNRIVEIDKKSEVYVTDQITIRTSYRIGCFITSETHHSSDMPCFYQICRLFIFKNEPFAICESWICDDYDDDLCAFIIEKSSAPKYSIFNIANLSHKVSYDAHQACDKSHDIFIVPKYQILN